VQSTILNVGRLVPRKGQIYLLEAAKKLVAEGMDLKLVIVGIGPEEKKLRQLAEGLDFRLELVISDKQLEDEYKNADVFALPSITDDQGEKEGLGLVLLEAMHHNLPVIAFENGGTREVVINDFNGILLPEKDIDGLAAAIRKVLTDPEFRNRIIQTAYEDAHKRFSVETIINNQLEIYDRILDKTKAANC